MKHQISYSFTPDANKCRRFQNFLSLNWLVERKVVKGTFTETRIAARGNFFFAPTSFRLPAKPC